MTCLTNVNILTDNIENIEKGLAESVNQPLNVQRFNEQERVANSKKNFDLLKQSKSKLADSFSVLSQYEAADKKQRGFESQKKTISQKCYLYS